MFNFGIYSAFLSYGTWRIYLRHCGRVAFDLYPDHRFSRHYQLKVRRALERTQATDRRPVIPALCACFANGAPCRGESTATVVATGSRVCDRHALDLATRVRVVFEPWC